MYKNVISLVARGTNSGKTYLMERLIEEMKRRGRKVATLKHTVHPPAVDSEGKDTDRFIHRGADRVVLFSDQGLILYEAGPIPVDHLYALSSGGMDVVLVEGFKRGPFKKIEVFNEELYDKPLSLDHPGPDYLAIVSRKPMDIGIPHFCFEDIGAICTLIEESAGLSPNPAG